MIERERRTQSKHNTSKVTSKFLMTPPFQFREEQPLASLLPLEVIMDTQEVTDELPQKKLCWVIRNRWVLTIISAMVLLFGFVPAFISKMDRTRLTLDTVIPDHEDRHVSVIRTTKDVQEVIVKSKEHDLPFPVVVANDKFDVMVPASMKAADVLECRESVIAFVINATDAKDECNGLKKAFDKTCNSDSTQEIIEKSKQKEIAANAKKEAKAAAAAASDGQERRRKLFQNQPNTNTKLKILVYRTFRWWSGIVKSWSQDDEFYADEQILAEWNDAHFQVEEGLDTILHTETIRRIQEEIIIDKEEAEKAEATVEVEVSKPDKPKQSLTLPTSNEHLSDKMITETLMIQNEDTIQSAIRTAADHTNATLNEAAVDAVASATAVQDTTAVVSAVLNDPTSVEARTCCASILNVFHENCDQKEEETVSDKKLFLIVFVIAFCGMVKSMIRHFKIRWLPEAAGCILVGVLCGAAMSFLPGYDISLDGAWFLRIMVPPIVFEAALSIDKKSFNRHVVPIIIYAVAGTLLATLITATIVHKGTLWLGRFCETIPYVESLAFGALISSIDPIAVLSVLSNMGMTDTDTIYVIIFGESLLNDGVAIVLFQTLVHFLDDSLVIDSEAVINAAIHFTVIAFGSLFVGIGSGIACTFFYWAMHGMQTALVEVLMFFCWAFIPYYICDGIGWSGIVSVVATGFVMDINVIGPHDHPEEDVTEQQDPGDSNPRVRAKRPIFGKGHLSAEAKAHVGFVTEILATVMETSIFAYLGVFLFSYRYHWSFWHMFLSVFACCLSRAIMIPLLSLLANWVTTVQQLRANWRSSRNTRGIPGSTGVIIDRKMQIVLWFAGLRGAMSFALVETIPMYDTVTGEGSRLKPELKAMTSACIVFTVFVLGGSTFSLTERLGLAPKQKGSTETISLISGMRNSALDKADDDDSSEVSFIDKIDDPTKVVRLRPKGPSEN